MLGATVMGRFASLTAAFIVLFVANSLIAVVIATTLILFGVPAVGAVTLQILLASSGWLFAAIAAIAAQLTESSGNARGISLAILGLFIFLRFADNTDLLPW